MKKARKDKTPGIDGLHHILECPPLLELLFSHWMEYRTIPQFFTKDEVKLLCKKKHAELKDLGQDPGEPIASCAQLSDAP